MDLHSQELGEQNRMTDQALASNAPISHGFNEMAQPPNSFARIWNVLTRPHASITDIEMRRQSRLLAALMLAVLLTTTLADIALTARSEGGIPITVIGLLVGQAATLALYLLNRNGRYQISALLFVALNFALIHLTPIATGEVAWLFFSTMALILSAFLLPVNYTVWLYLASIAVQIALGIIHPVTETMGNFGALVVFFTTSALVLVFVRHRNALERERQEELKQANEKLRKSEAALELRVAERTAELEVAKRDAEESRDRALEADKTKSQFLASMSHELRTPMNSILTFTELIAMGTFGDVNEEQKDYLLKSLQSGRHLLSLINDVLDITKIQSGMMRLFIENDFDVGHEMEQIAASTEKLLAGKPVKLVLDVDPEFPHLTCDKRRVRQVLLNLISNAVKFTEEGTITVSAKKIADAILFAVADTGPGIAPDQLQIIFEPFIQTETGIRHLGGTGLGLPISRSLVEAHGGHLSVDSTPGKGAAFIFTIPLNLEAEAMAKGTT